MVQNLLSNGTPFDYKGIDFTKLRDKYEQFEKEMAAEDVLLASVEMHAFVLYDPNEHGPDAYVSGVQEGFLIATMGPRKDARPYSEEHAIELIRKFREVGRHFRLEKRSKESADTNDTQDDGKGGLMSLSPAPQVGEADIPVRDMRYIDQRDERFGDAPGHIPTFEDED